MESLIKCTPDVTRLFSNINLLPKNSPSQRKSDIVIVDVIGF